MLFKFKMLHLFLAALKKLEYDSYKVWYSENDFFPSAELFLLPPTCTISECQLKPSAKMLIKKWYIVVTIVVFTSPLSLEKLLQNAKSAVAERFGQNIENSEEHVFTYCCCCHFWPYESTFSNHKFRLDILPRLHASNKKKLALYTVWCIDHWSCKLKFNQLADPNFIDSRL